MQMFRTYLAAAAIGVVGTAAAAQGYGYTLPDPNKPKPEPPKLTCQGTSMCFDETGERVRLNRGQMRDLGRHQGVRAVGCSTRELSPGVVTEAEIACIQRLFGLAEVPPDDEFWRLLDTMKSGDRDQAMKFAKRIGYEPGNGGPAAARAKEIAKIDPVAIVTGRDDAAKYRHPVASEEWGGASVDSLEQALTRGGGMWVATRWPDLPDMAGLTISVIEDGKPLLTAEFGPEGGRVEDAQGRIHEADYDSKGGFDCIPAVALLKGGCLGIAVQRPIDAEGPWLLRAAMRGKSGPILFGDLSEGRDAFDHALGSHAIAQAATEAERAAQLAQLANGEMLDRLPVDGVDPGDAWYMQAVYQNPVAPEAEYESVARLPFLAFHGSYAQVCRDDFDGDPRIWRSVQTRLIESGDVPGSAYRIYEEYVAAEIPVQASYYTTFAAGMDGFLGNTLKDGARNAKTHYPLFADFLEMVIVELQKTQISYASLIEHIGCKGPTIDRLERNLSLGYNMIGR